jgi:inner membrane transporter RhtA
MVLLGALFVQYSAALVAPIFVVVGAAATSAWRFSVGALVLLALARPRVWRWSRRQWIGAFALGISTAFMNLCFFQAIDRINLGTAVAIEYLGPFLVAALGKRSLRHVVFVLVAALGVLALARPGGDVSVTGLVFAGFAGVGWAGYAFASYYVGDETPDFDGLAMAMAIAAFITLPFLPASIVPMFDHGLVPRMVIASVAAVVLGFGAEMQALRRLPPSIVGVLLALDPAVAFAVGFVVLGQPILGWDIVGVGLVIISGIAVTRDA